MQEAFFGGRQLHQSVGTENLTGSVATENCIVRRILLEVLLLKIVTFLRKETKYVCLQFLS